MTLGHEANGARIPFTHSSAKGPHPNGTAMTTCEPRFNTPWRTRCIERRALAGLGAAGLLMSIFPDVAPAQSAPASEYLPVCTIPNCLNPRVVSKSGVGSANAVAEAKVVREDAVAWCAKYNARNPTCVADQVVQGGTGGGAKFKTAFRAQANCPAGSLTAVDGGSYSRVGTWPDGPGRGRSKFQGSLSQIGGRQFQQQDVAGLANGSTTIYQMGAGANSGESLAIQWEVLCSGASPAAPKGAGTNTR